MPLTYRRDLDRPLSIEEMDDNFETLASGSSTYTETIVNISSAEILAMGDTPIELLPASGVGNYYDIEKVVFEFTYGSEPYVIYGEDDFPQIAVGGVPFKLDRGLIEYEQDVILFWNSNIVASTPVVSTYCVPVVGEANQPVILMSSGEVGFGDGTLRVKIYHKTITFGA
jgi:hypothetical protein